MQSMGTKAFRAEVSLLCTQQKKKNHKRLCSQGYSSIWLVVIKVFFVFVFFLNSICYTSFGGFPGGTSDKESACQCQRRKRRGLDCWVGKTPWRRGWLPTPVFSPGKSHGQKSLAHYSPWGCRVATDHITHTQLYQFYLYKTTKTIFYK